MRVRLIAFREATDSATSQSTYQLDLQTEPNISVNYRFSDIKEPDTRKSTFSQTFKLPFTDNNNNFFQNWYNVNASTLVFDTKKKFNATLFVGSVPQMEGFLQLKAVYQKAQVYEVVLMSNAADLFSAIGEKKLRDVFLNEDGSYSREMNHIYNADNLVNSWTGNTTTFVSSPDGNTFQDSVANVQKLMYPMSVTKPKFYFNPSSNSFLNMSSITNSDVQYNNMVDITQFRPALQIRHIIELLIARAGFRFTSSFLDSVNFRKIFMTTGNHLEGMPVPLYTEDMEEAGGLVLVGNSATWGYFGDFYGVNCPDVPTFVVPANTVDSNGSDCWNTTDDYFTKKHPTQSSISVRFKPTSNNMTECNDTDETADVWLEGYDTETNTPLTDIIYASSYGNSIAGTVGYSAYFGVTLDINDVPIGASFRFIVKVNNTEGIGSGSGSYFQLGSSGGYNLGPWDGGSAYWKSEIRCQWSTYDIPIYGSEVNVPMCIDPEISQAQFLKDIIQRFNLIVLSDPEDSTNLIIEPYNDYLQTGSLKDWTDKVDTNKEIVITDTTSLQKKEVNFTDLEDEDMANKATREENPSLNVYGKVNIRVTDNQFASGELKNDPIFSPYINEKIYVNSNTTTWPHFSNFVVQYEYSYKQLSGGGYEIDTGVSTKPKLFWFNGMPTTVNDWTDDTAQTYYMHESAIEGAVITPHSFTTFPLCTPYDITPNETTNNSILLPTNKSLYWNSNPPIAGEMDIFNYNSYNGSWFANTLYGLYWKPYLDNIYSSEARLMEVYLNLNEVDIFQFKFNDEIFIKDSYWRILEITNYQVGQIVSTKVKMLKVVDTLHNCNGCSQVPGYLNDTNIWGGVYYLWCDDTDPSCTPGIDITGDFSGLVTSPECCECVGGTPLYMGYFSGVGAVYLCGTD